MAAIRPSGIGDAERIAQIHVLAWQVGYRGPLPQPVLDDLRPAQLVSRWTATLQRADWPRRGTLLAEDAGVAVRFADLRPTEDVLDVGEIASFYVLPAAWGRGIGRALNRRVGRDVLCGRLRGAVLWGAGVERSRDPVLRPPRAGSRTGRSGSARVSSRTLPPCHDL